MFDCKAMLEVGLTLTELFQIIRLNKAITFSLLHNLRWKYIERASLLLTGLFLSLCLKTA